MAVERLGEKEDRSNSVCEGSKNVGASKVARILSHSGTSAFKAQQKTLPDKVHFKMVKKVLPLPLQFRKIFLSIGHYKVPKAAVMIMKVFIINHSADLWTLGRKLRSNPAPGR